MFEFQLKSYGQTSEPDSHGLFHFASTFDVLIQHIEVEDDGTEFGSRRMSWVESGWLLEDTSIKIEGVMAEWTPCHSLIYRSDGTVAYAGSSLALDDVVQILLDEGAHHE